MASFNRVDANCRFLRLDAFAREKAGTEKQEFTQSREAAKKID
jgi:hypothetical protein